MRESGERRFLVSQKVLNRDEVVRDFVSGRLTRKDAASVLDLSERQLSRQVKRWRKNGILGLEHKLLGKSPWNQTSAELKETVLKLLQGKYAGFNLKHFHEQLVEQEKIQGVSYSTIKRLAREIGISKAKKRRPKIRKNRARFTQEGFMLQMDGSKHVWWNGKECCLIAGIDDATSEVPYGEFFETETLEGYMRVLRRIIELKGIPRVVYVDRASWLGGLSKEEKSQFQRICEELGIRVIFAGSPEAKGRIERTWGTLQDRLVSEFRLHKVQSIEAANEYLNSQFLPKTWLKKFTKTAQNPTLLYRPRPKKQDLDQIFCLKLERKIRKDHTLLFGNEVYAITAPLRYPIARKHAEVRIYLDGGLQAYYGGQDLEIKALRSSSWERRAKPKTAKGLSPWLRLLETEYSLNTAS